MHLGKIGLVGVRSVDVRSMDSREGLEGTIGLPKCKEGLHGAELGALTKARGQGMSATGKGEAQSATCGFSTQGASRPKHPYHGGLCCLQRVYSPECRLGVMPVSI
jgi:hypothetical protein